jgi:hypothetical protein
MGAVPAEPLNRYWILDPPTHASLPSGDAENADSKMGDYCVNLRDLRKKLNRDLHFANPQGHAPSRRIQH